MGTTQAVLLWLLGRLAYYLLWCAPSSPLPPAPCPLPPAPCAAPSPRPAPKAGVPHVRQPHLRRGRAPRLWGARPAAAGEAGQAGEGGGRMRRRRRSTMEQPQVGQPQMVPNGAPGRASCGCVRACMYGTCGHHLQTGAATAKGKSAAQVGAQVGAHAFLAHLTGAGAQTRAAPTHPPHPPTPTPTHMCTCPVPRLGGGRVLASREGAATTASPPPLWSRRSRRAARAATTGGRTATHTGGTAPPTKRCTVGVGVRVGVGVGVGVRVGVGVGVRVRVGVGVGRCMGRHHGHGRSGLGRGAGGA